MNEARLDGVLAAFCRKHEFTDAIFGAGVFEAVKPKRRNDLF